MRVVVTLLLAAGLLAPATSRAAAGWPCWGQAARRYNVDVSLLYAIARVETGARTGLVGRNAGGSYDIGLMQINSSWLPTLSRYGITEQKLRADACLNLHVGAWILSKTLRAYGLNWRGVGAYNAGSDAKRAVYARKVAGELARIHQERNRRAADLADAGQIGSGGQ